MSVFAGNRSSVCGLMALVCATGVCLGQTLEVKLYAEQDGVLIGPGEVAAYPIGDPVHFVLMAEFVGGEDAYFGAVRIDLLPDDVVDGFAGGFTYGSWPQGSVEPTLNGPEVLGIEAQQMSLLGSVDMSNPLVLCEFTVDTSGLSLFSYDALVTDVFAFAVYPDSGIFTLPVMFGTEVFSSVQVFVGGGGGNDPCNEADLAKPFGVLDLEDLTVFVNAFLIGDSTADLAEPFGVLDLADLFVFVDAFLAGCP